MAATTHTEVYRPFRGKLSAGPFGFLAIASSGIRAAMRKKVPLLCLFAPPTIGTIALSFAIYLRYSALEPAAENLGMRGRLAMSMADQLLAVRELVVQFNTEIWPFALLVIAWFGSGLLAEDRRVGAHQLYFARPLGRWGYLGAKFLVAAFFGSLALLAPVLILCLVAAFSSPDWVFLKEDWPDIVHSIEFAALIIGVLSLMALAFSSVSSRRIFAMAAMFGFVMLSTGFAAALRDIYDDERYLLLCLPGQLDPVREWLFDRGAQGEHPDLPLAAIGIGLTASLSMLVLWWRSRKLEVVA